LGNCRLTGLQLKLPEVVVREMCPQITKLWFAEASISEALSVGIGEQGEPAPEDRVLRQEDLPAGVSICTCVREDRSAGGAERWVRLRPSTATAWPYKVWGACG
jgi:hypothetical protein